MLKCIFIILVIGNFYQEYLKVSFFQKQYKIEKLKNSFIYLYQNNVNSAEESYFKDFTVYALEFIACLPVPFMEAYAYFCGPIFYPCSSWSPNTKFILYGGLLYLTYHSLILPPARDFVGKITGKKGNLRNAIIGTLISSSITWGIWCYTFVREPPLPSSIITKYTIIMATLPPLFCVTGYNLKY